MLRAIFFFSTIVPLFAQFGGLSSTNDGSQLYFSSSLQLNGCTGENSYAKIFRYDSSGLHFVAQADRVAVTNAYPRLSNPYNLAFGYISGNGSVTGYSGFADCAGFQFCASTPGISQTTLQYPGVLFPTILPYRCVITNNAQCAACATVDGVNFTQYEVFDLFGNPQTPIYTPICNEQGTGIPAMLSSDGQFLCENSFWSAPGPTTLWSASGPTSLNLQGIGGLLSDDGSRIVTWSDSSFYVYSVATASQVEIPSQNGEILYPLSLSNSGNVILCEVQSGGVWQLAVIHADGTGFLQLTNEPADTSTGLISGDGATAFVLTNSGRLLKFDTTTGASTLVANGAVLQFVTGAASPGAPNTITGSGLADATVAASAVPLATSLGGVQVTVNGVSAPLFSVSPTSIVFQIPWETTLGNASVAVVRPSSPFMQPIATLQIQSVQPVVALEYPLSQDFKLNPDAKPGDIVSFYLTGLGPVTELVADGAPSPSAPLPLLVHPVTVSGGSTPLNVLYAGLAPGLIGIYQVTVQLPTSFAGIPSLPFGFGLLLTLNSSVHLPPVGTSRN